MKNLLDRLLALLKNPHLYAAVFTIIGSVLGMSGAWVDEKTSGATLIAAQVAIIIGLVLGVVGQSPIVKEPPKKGKK